MAPIGQKYSYGTDAPLQKNYIGEAMTQVDDIAFRNRQEQLAKDRLKKAEDDVKLKELEDYNAKFGVKISGNQSIDDTTTQYAMQAKQQANDLTKQIQQTTDFNKKSELMGKRAKIVQSFDILKQIPDMLIKAGADIADGVEKGKYNPDDVNLIQDKFKSLEQGKVHYYTDDAGNLRFTTYKIDEKGNPTGIIDKDQTVAEMVKSLTPNLASKYDTLLKSAVDNTAVQETQIQKGLTTITNKGVAKEVANDKAIAFGNLIANNPAEAYALGKRFGIDPADKEAIAQKAGEEFKNSLDTTYKKSFDSTEARLRAKQAKEDKEKEIMISKPTFVNKAGYTESGVPLQRKTASHALGNVIIDSGQGKKEKATNVYVSPGGKMYLRVEETGFEGDSKKTTRYTEKGLKRKAEAEAKKLPFTPEFDDIEDVTTSNKAPKVIMYDFGKDDNQIGRFALKMGYDGAKSLQDDFIERSGGDNFITTPDERNQPKPKKIKSGEVIDGYRFLGGDPNNSKNWKKV